ncbi:hypothetical protein [Enterococcus rivorum]|uniref:Uncharacterized protein n=1 Tax=Enterococcus rivorum TaxID=762845 RepID=A0A1E5KUF6_9ENTE|nr:hypothetical protein [Enterococcus rivorum]MBP2099817.1 hypothetical protein [Enterococcus rivorum]OEH81525.1 hypothetical protein BCR26_04600 [Enterococcus rivorum]
MKEQLELYKKWAPDTSLWTQWAKPVVFMNLNTKPTCRAINISNVQWTSYADNRLLIVDLAEGNSIKEGLGLAKKGYRPVPLFNGVPGEGRTAVSMKGIVNGLRYGGFILEETPLKVEANPVFLLDSNRFKGAKVGPGIFDNRWCVVLQDMPSASYLKKQGIKEIIVRTDEFQKDLKYILYHYHKEGIIIYLCDKKGNKQIQKIAKPKNVSIFYRFLLLLGLARNAAGGFGMSIPEASSGGGGYRAG